MKKNNVITDIYKIETLDMNNFNFDNYNLLCIAYLVHSFNAPQIVVNFVKQLPSLYNKEVFIINSAGEYNLLNFASSKLIINILNKKGYNVLYDKQFIMPSNFIVKYKEYKVLKLLNEVNKEIPNIVKNIIDKKMYFIDYKFASKSMAYIGRLEWFGAKMIGRFFYANINCNQCRLCIKNCPNNNIKMLHNKIKFHWKCCICMRCVYQCPKQSIQIRQPFKFIKFDNWYENEELSGIKKINEY